MNPEVATAPASPEVLQELRQAQVYQTRPDGVFVGYATADESPLEPGVYLLPGGCVAEEPPTFGEGFQARWVRDEDGDGGEWIIEELDSPEPIPEVSNPTIEDYRHGIQLTIDKRASERGYDNGATCASYTLSTNTTWRAEAQTFVAWRDSVWEYVYQQWALVASGAREQSTINDFIKELPILEWPAIGPLTPPASNQEGS